MLQEIFDSIDLRGPALDVRAAIIGSLLLCLIAVAVIMVARIFGIRLGGFDDD
ncbi:hypothetical protein [uncultured Desulfuromonas sp.]|uniref:hypothetical protein n=1 Tax=uncultured Desulfuromonas sp. TaxID=181013 RepID=UPI002AAB18BD|nr:hypothetical protein [uncultured Desulfuromonas sp.]